MTEEDQKALDLLIDLNGRAKLVILDGPRDSVEPFWIAHEIGFHESTGQIVFRRGVRIDRPGEDFDAREQVQWLEEE
jgi:hypothetical protein